MAVKPVPEGYHTVTPYLAIEGATSVLDFVKEAFGAEELYRIDAPGDKIGHAEVKIGDSIVMVADASTGDEATLMPGMLHLYVDDVDKVYRKAIEAGAASVREPEDQFYGDRTAGVKDSAGNHWYIATHTEDVPPEEMNKRAQEWQERNKS